MFVPHSAQLHGRLWGGHQQDRVMLLAEAVSQPSRAYIHRLCSELRMSSDSLVVSGPMPFP